MSNSDVRTGPKLDQQSNEDVAASLKSCEDAARNIPPFDQKKANDGLKNLGLNSGLVSSK